MRRAWHAPVIALLAIGLCGGCLVRDPPTRTTDGRTGIELVLIQPGTFTMGSPDTIIGREPQESRHDVTISTPFYLGRTEVTQEQWTHVMGTNPAAFTECGPKCPVESVNFLQVQEFLAALNRSGGPRYRLPTEAEWEYACRAGGEAAFGHRSALSSADANIDGRFPYAAAASTQSQGPLPVGHFAANPWGLLDMQGNVWEWVEDEHCAYAPAPVRDPLGACGSNVRVIRGGSWKFDGNSARCALRYTHREQDRGYSLGLRLARSVD
jgi:formylglycine-generating enzyme required for sulfatase activity